MFRIMCKPMYTATPRGENHYRKLWRLLFIFSTGFRLSHKTSSQRISCLVKILETPLDFVSKDYCCRFSLYGLFLSALIKVSRVTYQKIELKKTTFQFLFRKFELLLRCYKKKI